MLFRLGYGSQSPLEATEYPLTRMTDNYALLNSLYRDNWVVQNVVGLMVDSDPFEIITTRIMQETAKLLELDFVPTESDVHLVNMCGPGYAIPSPEGNVAIRMMAANEGLFLDPVYTGKAFAGLIKLAREGKFKPDDNVLYLYSGGAGGLFAIDVDLG